MATRSSGNMAGPMDAMEKIWPKVDDMTFWLVVNIVLFLFVGIFQLAYGYGPGTALSAGAILLAFIYLVLWFWGKTNKKIARQLVMMISGLAVLGDIIVVAWLANGSFSGTSALLDFAGIMLYRSAYKLMGTA
ncbi:MAG: hypothetical protein HY296_08430 [Thaumarchaeota archaeon]|nr:hypothetical protein [Nitrososphaerota archaeon]